MVLDDLLDLRLELGGDVAGGNLLEERALCRRQVLAELSFPLGDLVDGDGVKLKGICQSTCETERMGEWHIRDR